MKSLIKVSVLLLALGTSACVMQQEATAPQRSVQQQPSVDFQVFYNELSPYGTWVDYPGYGYVWMPDAGAEFTPYATDGHWVYTEDGWTWVSDYAWGWAPFHYGRWDRDDMHGWFWVPDNEWGPAWVSWRGAQGYYGWAPLRPGISVNVAMNRDYHERDDRWIFVRDMDMTDPDIGRRYVDRRNNITIINNSTVIVNTQRDRQRNAVYIAGPDRDDFQRTTRTRVTPVVIRDNDRPGHRLSNGELQIYRPQIRTRGTQNPAPPNVKNLQQLPPASTGNGGNRQRDVNQPNNGGTAQPRNPTNAMPPNPTNAMPPNNPNNGRTRDQQPVKPTDVIPPATGGNNQQPKPMNVVPQNNGRRDQQLRSRNVAPPNSGRKDQQPKQPGVNPPPNTKGNAKQPQNVAPPKRTRDAQPPAQPKPNPDEKEKRKHEEER